MLYVGSHRKQDGVDLFGVTDTDDGVTQFVSGRDLLKAVNECGLSIEGVSGKRVSLVEPIVDEDGTILGVMPKSGNSPSQSSGKQGNLNSLLSRRESASENDIGEHQSSMSKWVARANKLGTFNNFVFDQSQTTLVKYQGDYNAPIELPPVKTIGAGCFDIINQCSVGVRATVIMPSSVEVIETKAFAGIEFTSGSKLDFSHVRVIGDNAFLCAVFPSNTVLNLASIEQIGYAAFSCASSNYKETYADRKGKPDAYSATVDDSHLVEVIFGNKLTETGAYVFECTKSLKRVKLSQSITQISEGCFLASGLESIDFPNQATVICHGAFRYSALKSVKLPVGNGVVAAESFADCTQLRNVVVPSGITKIEGAAFNGCEGLQRAELPAGLQEMEGYAFGECYSLVDIVLPNGLKYIPDYAFKNCVSLLNIDVPDTVTSIGFEAVDCEQHAVEKYGSPMVNRSITLHDESILDDTPLGRTVVKK